MQTNDINSRKSSRNSEDSSGSVGRLVRCSVIKEYYDKCVATYGENPTPYQSGVLLGMEIALGFAEKQSPSGNVHPLMSCSNCGEFQGHGHECWSVIPQPADEARQ